MRQEVRMMSQLRQEFVDLKVALKDVMSENQSLHCAQSSLSKSAMFKEDDFPSLTGVPVQMSGDSGMMLT